MAITSIGSVSYRKLLLQFSTVPAFFVRAKLWELGFKFSSVFGHSHDKNPNINLDHNDMNKLSDPRANFPGCIKWGQLFNSDGLSVKSRNALDRMRDLLFFNGTDEVIPFLELMISDLSRLPSMLAVDDVSPLSRQQSLNPPTCALSEHANLQRDGMDSRISQSFDGDGASPSSIHNHFNPLNPSFGASSRLFESLGIKRLLANFSFRGCHLSIPIMLWNIKLNDDKYSLKVESPFIPSTLRSFTKGLQLVLSSHYYRVGIQLSESCLEAWKPISDVDHMAATTLQGLKVRCPEVIAQIHFRQPLDEFFSQNQKNMSSKMFLFCGANRLFDEQIDSQNQLCLITSNSETFLPPESSAQHFSNRGEETCSKVVVPFSTDRPLSIRADNRLVHPENYRNGDIVATTNQAVGTVNSTNNKQNFQPKRLKRRIGQAPSLSTRRSQHKSTTRSSRSSCNISSVAITHRIEADEYRPNNNVLSYLNPIERQSVTTIQSQLICLVGSFPFLPFIVKLIRASQNKSFDTRETFHCFRRQSFNALYAPGLSMSAFLIVLFFLASSGVCEIGEPRFD